MSTQLRMRQFVMEGVKISVDHENVILCHGLILASRDDFEFMWHLHNNAVDERKKFYLKVIGCIESEEILMDFLSRMFELRNEWKEILLATITSNRIGLKVALDFLKTNYDRVIGL